MTKVITQQLKDILDQAGWTQEELARKLNVPQKTVSFWINEKTLPRKKAQDKINDLYLSIVGREEVDPDHLKEIKAKAIAKTMTAEEVRTNQELLDIITLYLTYHTNTIEGSTMTLADVEEVLNSEEIILPNKTAKEQTEARNHRTALLYLLREFTSQGDSFKWTVDFIKQIHLRLMNSLINNAGEFRQHGVRIVGSITKLVDHDKIDAYMKELVEDLNKPHKDAIEHIANIHARFERIHPFSDGNGRAGRLIMTLQALQYNITPPLITKERKRAYYKYLEATDIDNNYSLLELFIAESILITDELATAGSL